MIKSKKTKEKLSDKEIEIGIYEDSEGKEYAALDTAYHTETNELLVVYRDMFGDYKTHVMPIEKFKLKFVHTRLYF